VALGDQAEHEFDEILHQSNTDAAEMIQSLRRFLHENDMMAYLIMMGNRLLELHRVLKPTGSLYLHCDPTASHYLKIMMDSIFGPQSFRNEIIWKRTSARSNSHRWNHVHDVILFYSKSDTFTWNTQYIPYDKVYTDKFYHFIDSDTGRRYASDRLWCMKG
jgi:site-specific DNA-methyltransferase (adenine-specific)